MSFLTGKIDITLEAMTDRPLLEIVRLTPPGRGAVATLLVEGPGAIDAVGKRFHPGIPESRPVFGYFDFGGRSREEVVVHVRSSRSIEICCHGGHAAVEALEGSLISDGGRAVGWRDWLGAHEADPIAAAARTALAEARTERTALVLLDQYHGALRRAIESICRSVERHETASAADELRALLARAGTGRHLVEPWRVVLAGPPNAGKSSLINALVGYQRAIVHSSPGTTRDVVSATTAVEGWPIELSDTAGLRAADDALERAGVALARQKLAEADLGILVFDLSRPWTADDAVLVAELPGAAVVHNKQDLPEAPGPPRPAGLRSSAISGEGVQRLVRTLAERLVPEPPPPGAAVPFTADHIDRLRSAAEALARGDVVGAQDALSGI
jgi:tRNA modification GTPase